MRSQEYLLLSAVSRVSTVVPVPSGRHGRRRKRIFSGTAGRRRKSEPARRLLLVRQRRQPSVPVVESLNRDTKMGGGISTTVQFSVSAEASNSSVSLINNWHLSAVLIFSPLSHWQSLAGVAATGSAVVRPPPGRPPPGGVSLIDAVTYRVTPA